MLTVLEKQFKHHQMRKEKKRHQARGEEVGCSTKEPGHRGAQMEMGAEMKGWRAEGRQRSGVGWGVGCGW